MNWIILVVIASFLSAIVNTIDKYVLTKWVENPLVSVLVSCSIGLLGGVAIFLTRGFAHMSFFNIFLAFIAGLCYLLTNIFYFKAMKIEEMSRVEPLYHLSPLFILIFAAIFLGEVFTFLNYIGIFSLMAGAFLISSRSFSKITFNLAFWFVMISVLALSINLLLAKYLLNFADYWTVFSWISISAFIGMIPLIFIHFPDLVRTTKKYGKKVLVVMSLSETITVISMLLMIMAASIGYVTLVDALSAIQTFFVLLIALVFSIFYPSILKEEISKAVVFQKVIAVILLFGGVFLISGYL